MGGRSSCPWKKRSLPVASPCSGIGLGRRGCCFTSTRRRSHRGRVFAADGLLRRRDRAGPVPFTYVARTVNGAAVPGPLLENANYELLVVADTLRFGLFGEAEWTQVRRTTVGGVAREVEITRTEFSYRVRADSLRFILACPPDADCAPCL